ncbi:aldo/keto reductase [Victivallis sp. Marseille-Q1083]|uniref:aldo/keto reductase n=1 Tax=Victivallis sp. Marseille-Q1083 TaxID=2717288 RepID=UPI001C37C753|nr:aldo/keto reductase [Victivallis sp. Marseille-Q1083]
MTLDDTNRVSTRVEPVCGREVPLLGFGGMRLPTVAEGKEEIDEAKALEMVDYAYRHGVNYFDTARPYHGGLSEPFFGRALSRYRRESFFLATKMSSWMMKQPAEAEAFFDAQLESCRTEYFDFYLLHSLSSQADYEAFYEAGGALTYLQRQKAAGRIRRLGFSFHGSIAFLEYLLAKRQWDFVQIQLNYLDWDLHEAKRLYELLEEHHVPCIVMEPVRGGALAGLNAEAAAVLRQAAPDSSTASWAIRFVASLPNVLTVLSGMSTLAQVEDNVRTLADFRPLSAVEHEALRKALQLYLLGRPIPCTACRYCLPCPFGVDIPKVFAAYNEAAGAEGIPDLAAPRDELFQRRKEGFLWRCNSIPEPNRSSHCTACGHCVKACPQQIPIPDKMAQIAGLIQALQ